MHYVLATISLSPLMRVPALSELLSNAQEERDEIHFLIDVLECGVRLSIPPFAR